MPSNSETNIPASVYVYLAAAAYADFWSQENKVLPPTYLPGGRTSKAIANRIIRPRSR